MTTNDRTSTTILQIRAAHGNPNERCPTCGRAPSEPYRIYDGHGKVKYGCVDALHGGHLIGESARWHNRPEAKRIRQADLRQIGGGARRRSRR